MGTLLVCEKEPPPRSHSLSLFSHQPQRLSCCPQKASDLVDMINRVIREGLEGLVLKDVKVRGSQAPP